MIKAVYLIVVGVAIGILTLLKPKFFWGHSRANFVKRFLGETGTTIFYLLFSIGAIALGVFIITQKTAEQKLEEIAVIYNNGNIEEAQKQLIPYTAEHPDNYLAWTILGNIYLDKDSADKAIDCFNKGIKANSKGFESYNSLGLAYSKKGELEKAKEEYLKANALSPNEWSVVGNLAGLYDDLGDVKKSVEFGEKSILLNPENSTLFANLSIYYNKDNQFDKRDKMYKKAQELGYSDMEALTNMLYSASNDTLEAPSDTTSLSADTLEPME